MQYYRKYGNKKTTVDGISFHSKGEANRYEELKFLQKAGEISELEFQPAFVVLEPFTWNGKKIRGITYVADFLYLEKGNGFKTVEDFKGFKTTIYKMKKKMFLSKFGHTHHFIETHA